ncbi:hypothetical protein [Cupriavidus campinensis]|uniref:hypothetical protein n=1 Tax=Cupriavidus campinensis TaxID=151783 RepID=UPI0011EBA78D|nr:hypothetical protein [Cupriavidus campinensis]
MASATQRGAAPQSAGRLQPKLSALIAEVRAVRDELDRTLARHGMPSRDAAASRARLLDQWIRQAQGRRQLVCLACGAEQGLLQQGHLEIGRRTAAGTTDRALRALYWASVQRWSRAPGIRPMRDDTAAASMPAPSASAAPSAVPHMCGDCDDLRQDIRRYTPHAELERDGAGEPPRPHGPAECRYRCGTCATQWVRRVPPSSRLPSGPWCPPGTRRRCTAEV